MPVYYGAGFEDRSENTHVYGTVESVRYAREIRMLSVTAISLQGLSKSYGRLAAVRNLTLNVPEGEIFGFLGLNGAGKTTTIRILLDLLRPTSGKALIFDHDCQSESIEARSQVGYLPGEMGIYSHLTGVEVLDFLAGLNHREVTGKWRRELQDRLELPDSDLKRKLREYSTGMKRKLGLIQAFQADPRLLILDEPTEGLDPLMQGAFYRLLADAQRRGRTVFMSSHVLSEVERVCDRIAVIRKGELVLLSTVEEARRLAPRLVHVSLDEPVSIRPDFPSGIEVVELKPLRWSLRVEGLLGPLMNSLKPFPIRDIEIEEPRLEDVLMKYYRESQP